MLKMLKYVLLATLVSCTPILIAFRFANVTEVKFILLILVPPLIGISMLLSLIFYKFLRPLQFIWVLMIIITIGAFILVVKDGAGEILKNYKDDYKEFVEVVNEEFGTDLKKELQFSGLKGSMKEAFESNKIIGLDLIHIRENKISERDGTIEVLRQLDGNKFYYNKLINILDGEQLTVDEINNWYTSNEDYINVNKSLDIAYWLFMLGIGLIASLLLITIDGKLFQSYFKVNNMTEVEIYNHESALRKEKEENY